MINPTNVSNVAAFAVEWTAGDTGNTYQLINERGTRRVQVAARHAGADRWHTTEVTSPERFGMDVAPKTFAQFRAFALAFINA